MASRYQNYIGKRLNDLYDQTTLDNLRSRKKLYRFINFHWRTIQKFLDLPATIPVDYRALEDADRDTGIKDPSVSGDSEYGLELEKPNNMLEGLALHINEFIQAAPKLFIHFDSRDQRHAAVIAVNERLWNKLDPAQRWWAIFRFLPFVEKIIIRRQNALRAKSPIYGAKLAEKSLYDYMNSNFSDPNFFDGFSEVPQSNQKLIESLLDGLDIGKVVLVLTGENWNQQIKLYILSRESYREQLERRLTDEQKITLNNSYDFDNPFQVQEGPESSHGSQASHRHSDSSGANSDAERLSRSIVRALTPSKSEEQPSSKSVEPQTLPLEEAFDPNPIQLSSCEEEAEESEHIELAGPKEKEEEGLFLQGQEVAELSEQEAKYNYGCHGYEKEYPRTHENQSIKAHSVATSFERNNNPHNQFSRDVDQMLATLKSPGDDEFHGQQSASILKKLLYTFSQVDPMYKREGHWHRFSDSEIPLASILPHTARVTIQLPPKGESGPDLGEEFFKTFLWEGEPRTRHAATHGIVINPENEETCDGILKQVTEIKPKLHEVISGMVTGHLFDYGLEGHYGVNLAWGGQGNQHFLSGKTITNEGQNGHLYMYYKPATEHEPGAILVGIEESAPSDCASPNVQNAIGSVYDNVGGGHTIWGGTNPFAVGGNDKWGRAPKYHKDNAEYVGLSKHGPSEYYDSLFCHLSPSQIEAILSEYDPKFFDDQILSIPPQGEQSTLGHEGDYYGLLAQNKLTHLAKNTRGIFEWFSSAMADIESSEDKGASELDGEFEHLESEDEARSPYDVDFGYRQEVLRDVVNVLDAYLRKEGAAKENIQKINQLLNQMEAIDSSDAFLRFVFDIENIMIKDGKKNIAAIVKSQGGRTLPISLTQHFKVQEEQKIHDTLLPNMWYNPILYFTNSVHFKDQLMAAHQKLIKLIPENIYHLADEKAFDSPQLQNWREQVMDLRATSVAINKAERDFIRDVKIEGQSGQDIVRIYKRDDQEVQDVEEQVVAHLERNINKLCGDGKEGEAKKRFILSSGGQDMTRFYEEEIYAQLQAAGMEGDKFRIGHSTIDANWYQKDSKTYYVAKVQVLTLHRDVQDPSQNTLCVLNESKELVAVEADENVLDKLQKQEMPKIMDIEINVRLDVKIPIHVMHADEDAFVAYPVVEKFDLSFYTPSLSLESYRPEEKPGLF